MERVCPKNGMIGPPQRGRSSVRLALSALLISLLAGCTMAISGSGTPATVAIATTSAAGGDTATPQTSGGEFGSSGQFGNSVGPPPPPMAGASKYPTLPRSSNPTTSSTPTTTRPSEVDIGDYLLAMTDTLLTQNRSAFLDYFVGAALPKATSWWDNMAAIGMDGGAVSTWFSAGRVSLDGSAAGTIEDVYLGGHFPGDGVDANGDLKISATIYDWDLNVLLDDQLKPTSIEITGWRSISRAPWDCDCALYVSRSAAGIVASLPDEAALADQILLAQDKANNWLAGFLGFAAPQISLTSQIATFVTFDDRLLYSWFSPADEVADPSVRDDFAAAVYPTFSYYGQHEGIAYNVAGTEPRMVVGVGLLTFPDPAELMVHELVHYHWDKYLTGEFYPSYQPYIAEGLAQMVEQVYYATDANSAASGDWVVGTPNQMWSTDYDQIETLFIGEVPTAKQLRSGTAEEINFWYDISSSTYNYVAVTYGMSVALQTSICAYQKGTVLGCIVDPATPGTYLDETTQTASWATWVRDTYGY